MDASVGLTFSLQLFQRYQRNGILQAHVHHIPGIQGTCTAYVHLTAGSVTTCYVKNKQEQHIPISIEVLSQVDHDRGPFEWVFQPQHPPALAQGAVPHSSAPLPNTAQASPELDTHVPQAVAPLRWEQFNHWTPEQKVLLQHVWQSIDGKRTVQELKASLSYSPQVIHDVVQILLAAQLIVLAS